jgi:hypothetical protein
MLFEYHKLQNRRKPNSVHATYLIYGAKHETSVDSDSDSSTGFALSLVSENNLEGKVFSPTALLSYTTHTAPFQMSLRNIVRLPQFMSIVSPLIPPR